MRPASDFIGSVARIPTVRDGEIRVEVVMFSGCEDGDLAVEYGDFENHPRPVVRIHSICVFAEALGSSFCDCADQLTEAKDRIRSAGSGMLVYLRVDGRGEGLAAKVAATALEVDGVDTYESRERVGVSPDSREYDAIGTHLRSRGARAITLLTNNPDKIAGIQRAGVDVATEPLTQAVPNSHVRDLYRTKAERFGHAIEAEMYAPDNDGESM